LPVGHQTRQLADQRQRILWHRPALLASPIHLQLQRGAITAPPMQDHLDEAAFESHDDPMQGRAQDPLASRCCRRWVRPGEIEIVAKLISASRPRRAPSHYRHLAITEGIA
jgi:hypothetical protein